VLGHAHITTTLNIYTHLFDHARHHDTLRERMSASTFASLLSVTPEQEDSTSAPDPI
jgi:hypothetical protein